MIHPSAVIDPKAEIADGVEIGPFSVIEAGVRIGAGTKIGPHVHIQGLTEIGRDNFIGTGAVLGLPAQHTAYKGAPTRLVIGDRNTIREYASVHRAYQEGEATVIGNDCFLMGFSHVAHDCRIDDGAVIANGALVAGHVTIGSRAFVSGNVVIHQFCRIGRLAMLSGLSGFGADIPPFTLVQGIPGRIRGLNVVGLRRAGIGPESRKELKRLLHLLYRGDKTPREAIAGLNIEELGPEAREYVEFYTASKRGISTFQAYSRKAGEAEAGEGSEG